MIEFGIKTWEISGHASDVSHVDLRPPFTVLLLSQRRIADLAAYCLAYEFEDTFATVTDAQRIDATNLPALEFSRRAYKLVRLASGSPKLARRLALGALLRPFFPVFNHTYELYSLATIPN